MNLPPKNAADKQETPAAPKAAKVPFRSPKPGEVAFLLMPTDENEYQKVLKELADLGIDDQLPKLRKEIALSKLSKNHIVYTAVCVTTKMNMFDKQAVEWKLKISPAISAGDYLDNSDEDDETMNAGPFVDELCKHVRPMRVSISNDKSIKLLQM